MRTRITVAEGHHIGHWPRSRSTTRPFHQRSYLDAVRAQQHGWSQAQRHEHLHELFETRVEDVEEFIPIVDLMTVLYCRVCRSYVDRYCPDAERYWRSLWDHRVQKYADYQAWDEYVGGRHELPPMGAGTVLERFFIGPDLATGEPWSE